MIDIHRLLVDFKIPLDTRVNPGWINVHCPFCRRDEGFHGGFPESGDYFHCWKCGGHYIDLTIQKLLHISRKEYNEIIPQYSAEVLLRAKLNKKKPKAQKIEMPGEDLNKAERKYLKDRRFDPDFLVQKYGIRGGGIVGEWKFRILIPMYMNHQLISFTGRDITGQQKQRYKNLEIEKSVMDPKTIVFNWDNAPGPKVGIVEGPMDVFRMGDDFICTFGTSVTSAQIGRIAEKYKEVYFLFDPEEDAQKKAQKNAELLSSLGVEAWVVDIENDCDPGDLSEYEVERLRSEMGFR
jgi:DNA primase